MSWIKHESSVVASGDLESLGAMLENFKGERAKSADFV